MQYIFIITTSLFMMQSPKTIHSFTIPMLNSEEVLSLEKFKGKKILLVNVASECGYTPQYEDLQLFYEKYKESVVVIGLPCNQFGGQESGSEAEIAQFCKFNYGVTFPITTKIDVKGKDAHPIYQWLTKKDQNGVDDYSLNWNFNKFLVDENGKLMGHFGSSVNPFDDSILSLL